jgi:WD40 repeat protein
MTAILEITSSAFYWRRGLAILLLACLLAAPSRAADPAPGPAIPISAIARATPVDFETDILPIFRDNCLACHNRTRAKADLILETPADMLKGSENGPVVVPGAAAKSSLLQVAAHQVKPLMPPRDNKVSAADLTSQQLGLLRLWIDQGAKGEVRRATRAIEWQAPASTAQPVYAVALSPDGRFAAAGRGNHIDLYDLPAQRLVATLRDPRLSTADGPYGSAGAAHRDMVESLAFSPDGALLASGSFGEVKLWRRPAAAAARITLASAPNALVAAAPDGRSLVLAAEGAPLRRLDAISGKEIRLIAASTSAARAIAFSPDSRLVAVVAADRGLRISSIADGALLAQTVLSSADTTAIAWAAAGKQLATGSADGIIRVYSIPEPAAPWPAPRELKGRSAPITALAAFADGAQLLSGSADGSIRQWNLSDGQTTRQLAGGSPIAQIAIRPDARYFASAGPSGPPRLWDAAKGTSIELRGDARASRAVAQRERAQQIATADVAYFKSAVQRAEAAQKPAADRVKAATDAKAGADKIAADKEAARAKSIEALESVKQGLAAAQSDLRAKAAAVEAAERAVKEAQDALADAKADLERSPDDIKTVQEQIAGQAKAAEDAKAAAAKVDADIKGWQAAADVATKAVEKADGELKAALMARANTETEAHLADLASSRGAEELKSAQTSLTATTEALQKADAALAAARQSAASAADKPARAIAFSPDSLTLALATADGDVTLWTADGVALIDTFSVGSALTSVAFLSPDTLLISCPTQTSVWSLTGPWTLERTLGSGDLSSPLVDRVGALALSPDGRLLATGSGEPSRTGQIKLWDVSTGRIIRDFGDAHSDSVLALEFSPDGLRLASGSADRFAKIWDVSTGKLTRSLEGHTDHVLGVSWRADGRVLATCSADNQVKFWDATTGDRKAGAPAAGKAVSAVHFLGVGDQVLAASSDGQLRILNDAGAAVRSITGIPADFFHAAAATPDGHTFAAGGQSGQLTVWREPTTTPPSGQAIAFPAPTTRPAGTNP